MFKTVLVLIFLLFFLWLASYTVYLRIKYYEMLSFTMQQTIDKIILQQILDNKNDNDGQVINYINKIDNTISHIKNFGDVIYSPYKDQLDLIVSSYEDLKNNLKY